MKNSGSYKLPRKMKKELPKVEFIMMSDTKAIVHYSCSDVNKWTRRLIRSLIRLCKQQKAEQDALRVMDMMWKQERLDSLMEGGI